VVLKADTWHRSEVNKNIFLQILVNFLADLEKFKKTKPYQFSSNFS